MVIGLGGDGFIKKEPQALGSIEENSSIFRRDIVVIGASAGGVEALKKLAANLPGDLPAAIFVVVHFPVQSTSMLPKILEDSGRVPASHAVNGEPIQTGRIYVAPPNQHLQLEDGWVRLVIGPREHGFRPSIDLLFCSVAATYGERVIGVILSGTLYDGAAGMQAIHNNGGGFGRSRPG